MSEDSEIDVFYLITEASVPLPKGDSRLNNYNLLPVYSNYIPTWSQRILWYKCWLWIISARIAALWSGWSNRGKSDTNVTDAFTCNYYFPFVKVHRQWSVCVSVDHQKSCAKIKSLSGKLLHEHHFVSSW